MQVDDALKKNKVLDAEIIIYSSEFLRAKETAKIIADSLGIKKINYCEELRERYFGDFEKTDNSNYHKVWKEDNKDPDHKKQTNNQQNGCSNSYCPCNNTS